MVAPKKQMVGFSINLKAGVDPAPIKSQLEELIGEGLYIIDVRSIESISQALLKCTASPRVYQKYFHQPDLPGYLLDKIEEIVPDRNYLIDELPGPLH